MANKFDLTLEIRYMAFKQKVKKLKEFWSLYIKYCSLINATANTIIKNL